MIRLHAKDLESKWGFNDGDIFIDYEGIDHQLLLEIAVSKYLLPELSRQYQVLTYMTAHNPIRLSFYDQLSEEDENIYVDITEDQIMDMVNDLRKKEK